MFYCLLLFCYPNLCKLTFGKIALMLILSLFLQIDADEDIVMMLQKYVVANYQEQKVFSL